MAIHKITLGRQSGDVVDYIYPSTSADIVWMANGSTTLESEINSLYQNISSSQTIQEALEYVDESIDILRDEIIGTLPQNDIGYDKNIFGLSTYIASHRNQSNNISNTVYELKNDLDILIDDYDRLRLELTRIESIYDNLLEQVGTQSGGLYSKYNTLFSILYPTSGSNQIDTTISQINLKIQSIQDIINSINNTIDDKINEKYHQILGVNILNDTPYDPNDMQTHTYYTSQIDSTVDTISEISKYLSDDDSTLEFKNERISAILEEYTRLANEISTLSPESSIGIINIINQLTDQVDDKINDISSEVIYSENEQGEDDDPQSQPLEPSVDNSLQTQINSYIDSVNNLSTNYVRFDDLKEVYDNNITGWSLISKIIKMGFGRDAYPVGTEFKVKYNTSSPMPGEITFVCVGHDQILDSSNQHSMTLLSKTPIQYTLNGDKIINMDSPEAVYSNYDDLAIADYSLQFNGTIYYFSTTEIIRSGSCMVLDTINNVAKFYTNEVDQDGESINYNWWREPSLEIPITTSPISGVMYTSLSDTNTTNNINNVNRVLYGSGNYAQSSLRQWLNSSGTNATNIDTWYPSHKFDRPPSLFIEGFIKSQLFVPSFVNVLGRATIRTRTNSISETINTHKYFHDDNVTPMVSTLDNNGLDYPINSYYDLNNELFFIPSTSEIFGDTQDNTTSMDGVQYEYFADPNNTSFIQNTVLRSPYPDSTYEYRCIKNGVFDKIKANEALDFHVACIVV